MRNRPSKNTGETPRPLTKRQQVQHHREASAQRRVVLAIGGALLLALLLIAGGIVYDRMVVPGRAIKTVNGQVLNRGEYDRLVRDQTLQQVAQSLQFTKLFGPNASMGQNQASFTQQVIESNQQLAVLGTVRGRRQPVVDESVSQWVDAQLIEQRAREQFQIDPSQGEVDQLIVERLGSLLEEPAPLTSTAELTSTAGVSGTLATTATAGLDTATTTAGTAAPQATSAVTSTTAATPTTGPTGTTGPTSTPTASPVAEVATTKVDEIFRVLYDEYTAILNDLPREASSELREPHATQADLAAAVRRQYRDELIRTRVKERLVPTVNPEDTTEPTEISARHILLKVPPPEATPTTTASPDGTATAAGTATADGTATAETAATAEITGTAVAAPTPTLAPAALEALYEERRKEADAIYQQVTSNPDSFPDVAREKSEDTGSAEQGGDLGSFGRGQMVKAFEDAAFALKENEISQPVRSEFGWHIIQRLPEDPQAKLERQREAAFEAWLSEIRASATIVPAPTPTATVQAVPTDAATETAPEAGTAEATPADTAPAGTASPVATP